MQELLCDLLKYDLCDDVTIECANCPFNWNTYEEEGIDFLEEVNKRILQAIKFYE